MFINASPDSRSLDMVDLLYVFNLLSVLNEPSHSANVIYTFIYTYFINVTNT